MLRTLVVRGIPRTTRRSFMATSVEVRGAGAMPAAGGGTPLDRRAHALGLPSATALVIGSIIGTGVFTMPAVMAGAGTSSLITLGIISL
jgi:hypothetical protein